MKRVFTVGGGVIKVDKMRDEFEEWMVAYWHQPNLTIDKYGYENEIVSQQWEAWKQAWQASRKALVVELPNAWEAGCELVMNAHRVRMELERAGVSYE